MRKGTDWNGREGLLSLGERNLVHRRGSSSSMAESTQGRSRLQGKGGFFSQLAWNKIKIKVHRQMEHTSVRESISSLRSSWRGLRSSSRAGTILEPRVVESEERAARA